MRSQQLHAARQLSCRVQASTRRKHADVRAVDLGNVAKANYALARGRRGTPTARCLRTASRGRSADLGQRRDQFADGGQARNAFEQKRQLQQWRAQ